MPPKIERKPLFDPELVAETRVAVSLSRAEAVYERTFKATDQFTGTEIEREADALAAVAHTVPATIRAGAELPKTYELAKAALANCAKVDECKDWADKAAALASYARQAEDETLLKTAMRIQGRAIRRAGELLKQFDGRGEHRKSGGAPTSSQRDAAEAAGMSKDQQVTAVRVANVPEPEFEAAVESDEPPTVTRLAQAGTRSRARAPAEPRRKPMPAGMRAALEAVDSTPGAREAILTELLDIDDPKVVAALVVIALGRRGEGFIFEVLSQAADLTMAAVRRLCADPEPTPPAA